MFNNKQSLLKRTDKNFAEEEIWQDNQKGDALKGAGIFLREWASHPLEVAAVTPSSRHLAKIIASEISGETGPVIELGPGTGVFTQQLLRNGVNPQDLTLIEKSDRFAKVLKQKFPRLNVVNGDAALFNRYDLGVDQPFGATVSGMGMVSMPDHVIKTILMNCFENMADNGAFYQFTYFWRCPVSEGLLYELGLKKERIGYTLRNMPPACVYKISRV